MGNRAFLVLGVVALAILGAAWYVAGGPASSTPETVPSELVLNAVQTGSGSWVRYVVTIKNAGDADFSGEVVLLNRADPLLGSAAQPTPTPPGITQPKVPNQIPRLPAEAPDSSPTMVLGRHTLRKAAVAASEASAAMMSTSHVSW